MRLRLFGRRKWCPVLILCGSVVLVVTLLVSHSSAPKQVDQNSPEEKGCVNCLNPDPSPMSALDSNLLLILVHSSCKEEARRVAIRDTWLHSYTPASQDNPSPIQYRFVLGGFEMAKDISKQLKTESAVYKDLMILDSNPDTAVNLTQRNIQSFQYSMENFKFSYVLKCDEDSYVDVPRLATELQQRDRTIPLYWGEILNWEIYTEGIYGEKQFTVCERYLPYALGGGYVLSNDLIEVLVKNMEYLHWYVSEDVSMGAWLAPLNIERKHDCRFNTGASSRGCKDPYVVTHKVPASQMYHYSQVYSKYGRICSETNRDLGTAGHMYNWLVEPSRSISYSDHLP